jgi:NAD dependent epimerase/dehydratase family enzyme
MYVEALKNSSIQGVYNGTAPYPATNADFTKALGKVLRRPALAPAPAFALKMVFGEMSVILLEGQKVLPIKFKEKHFRFHYPTLEMALKETAY